MYDENNQRELHDAKRYEQDIGDFLNRAQKYLVLVFIMIYIHTCCTKRKIHDMNVYHQKKLNRFYIE